MDRLIEFLFTLSAVELGVGIAIAAGIVAIVLDWRLAMLAVLIEYLFVSLLLGSVLPAGLAMIKLLAGSVACMILYWTARRMQAELRLIEGGQDWFVSNRDIYPMGLPFRFLALLFTALALFTLPDRIAVDIFPRIYLVPALWLLAMGLLTIILTRDPLKTGMGLLTFQNGFDLLYSQIESGLIVIGFLGVGTILIGLVASYLAIARHLPRIERRRAMIDPRSPEALAEAVAALGSTPPVEGETESPGAPA